MIMETYTVIVTIKCSGLKPMLKFLLTKYPDTMVATYMGPLPTISKVRGHTKSGKRKPPQLLLLRADGK
jgi:hypothetical protein